MNLKNTSILTIISVSSLGLLSSCGKKNSDTKPASFSGSFKIVAFACGTVQSNFTPEGASPNTSFSSYLFTPIGSAYLNSSTNLEFKIKPENSIYRFIYNNNKTKCKYKEILNGSVLNTNNIIKLESENSVSYNPQCQNKSFSPLDEFNLQGEYKFAQNNGHFTLTSESNDYCNEVLPNSNEKLILTLKKK